MKISEITESQAGHLAWRIDNHTGYGIGTACSIARGEKGDLDLVDAFQLVDMTLHQAKIHARKVINFRAVITMSK